MKYLRHLESKNKSKTGLVSFLAVMDDVKEALEFGYKSKHIWNDLTETGRIKFSYRQFCHYVKKHIKGDIKPEKTKPVEQLEQNKTRKQIQEEYAAKFMDEPNPMIQKLINNRKSGE